MPPRRALWASVARNKRIFQQKPVVSGRHGEILVRHAADGDYVVVRKQRTARDGQIAVVQTDEGEATLKRFYLEKNRIRLEPANPTMKPIYVKNAKILGVVRKVE